MRRLVVAPGALDSTTIMQDGGILPIVLGGVAHLGPFARLVEGERILSVSPQPAVRLVALAARIEEDVDRVFQRLRLSNAERERMAAAVSAARMLDPIPNERRSRALLYRLGHQAWRDAVLLAFASRGVSDTNALGMLFSLPERWPPPIFPLSGSDVLREGGQPGPAVGALLKAVEIWWIENDFGPGETVLRQRLQQMLAAEQ
jgi:poly(A) polymerase/tRNA nucleotidyltransferase (CCA-adding enzyme)